MKNFMKKYHQAILITAIVILGIVLRFYQLGQVPVSLNWDETAWGYNAYALSLDAKDEFGVLLPFQYIESFGDFKPPLYAYVSIIPVMLFGLTEFATRFASAFFGSLTILLSYFLIKRIFSTSTQREYYALGTAFLLSISPWHIMLSRAAFEANLVTFFLVLGVWLFLKGIQEKSIYLLLSVIPFAASFYTFNTARIVTPLLVLVLVVSFGRVLMTKKLKTFLIAGLLGVILIAPLVPFLLSPQASLRFKEVNIFSDISVIERSNRQVANDDGAIWSKILHHRYGAFGVLFLQHYFDHFNPNFLFISGDENPKFSTQDVGQLYLFEIPFFIAGIIILLRRKEGYWWIVPLWLLIGIIPAATARETPHALRIESTLPMFQLISAIGMTWFLLYLKKRARIRVAAQLMLACVIVLNVVYFLHGYYAHYSREHSGDWQYGYKESIEYVQQVGNEYDEIHISEGLGRPYVYYLFYLKTDPKVFRKEALVERDVFGFVHVERFGKYVFPKKMEFTKPENTKILYITLPNEVPGGAIVKKQFLLRNGMTQLVAFTK